MNNDPKSREGLDALKAAADAVLVALTKLDSAIPFKQWLRLARKYAALQREAARIEKRLEGGK